MKPKKKTWESKTWNGDRNQGEEPVFTTLGKPKLGLQEPKSSSGGGVIMAVILLIIMICVAIFLVHKRQQMIKEEMKKQDAEAMKEDEANKKSTFIPVQAATMEKVNFKVTCKVYDHFAEYIRSFDWFAFIIVYFLP